LYIDFFLYIFNIKLTHFLTLLREIHY